MPYRSVPLAPGELYHLYLRGIDKQDIFRDTRDYVRFLFNILFMQGVFQVPRPARRVESYIKNGKFDPGSKYVDAVVAEREVALCAFSLMPNHFHLIVQQMTEGGISNYMMRVLDAYVKYFNVKHKRSGRLFESEFKSVHISTNEQLLHTSAYVHKNPHELEEWTDNEDTYPWSSLQDYVGDNRWGALLSSDLILDQFDDQFGYSEFVKTSLAKEL